MFTFPRRAWASKPGTDHVDHVREPQLWTLHDSAWQIARSSPKMTVLPLKERNTFADLYFALGVTQRLMDKALDSWTGVAALARVADRPANRDSMSAAAAEAEVATTNYDRGHFEYLEERFDRLGMGANVAALLPRPANYEPGCPKIEQVASAAA